ncbi:hypothetical protein FB451DRAFT_1486983 [Mycena latifolia]|nr:hypothetical protein FB451DRAFT_1486983 [Mycena latifolia]
MTPRKALSTRWAIMTSRRSPRLSQFRDTRAKIMFQLFSHFEHVFHLVSPLDRGPCPRQLPRHDSENMFVARTKLLKQDLEWNVFPNFRSASESLIAPRFHIAPWTKPPISSSQVLRPRSISSQQRRRRGNAPRDDDAVVSRRAEGTAGGDEDRRACDAALLWGGACGASRTHKSPWSVIEGFWRHTGHGKNGADGERGKEEREELEHCLTGDGWWGSGEPEWGIYIIWGARILPAQDLIGNPTAARLGCLDATLR